MSPDEALELARYAKQLMPKTTDEQAAQLKRELERYPFETARGVVREYAADDLELRVNVAAIKARLSAVMGEQGKADKAYHESLNKRIADRRAESERWQREAQADLDAAYAFCRGQSPEELDRMRTAIIGKYTPHSTERWRDKATLDSPYLVSLIYDQFGQPERRKERVSA